MKKVMVAAMALISGIAWGQTNEVDVLKVGGMITGQGTGTNLYLKGLDGTTNHYAEGIMLEGGNDFVFSNGVGGSIILAPGEGSAMDGMVQILDSNGQVALQISNDGAFGKGVWNIEQLQTDGSLITNLTVSSDDIDDGAVTSAKIAEGTITTNNLSFDLVAPGGPDRSLQFNDNGQLSGNTNYFMHSEENKVAFNCEGGNVLSVYKNGVVAPDYLIFRLFADENGVVKMMMNDESGESVVIDSQGNASFKNVEISGTVVGGQLSATNLSDGAVTAEKIATETITTTQIKDGSIQRADLGAIAGGTDGSIQFNKDGKLAGYTNFFIHAETGKMAFHAKEGNLWRAYKRGVVAPENLAYVVRDHGDTVELCLLTDGVEGIRLRGDGTAYIAGDLQIDGQLLADESSLTNLNISTLGGSISFSQLPNSGTWDASGLTISNLNLSGVIGDGSGLSVNTASGLESLETVLSELDARINDVYESAGSITVQVTDNAQTNGINLLAAYAAASDMNPSVSNRVAVIVPPGTYDMGMSGLDLTVEFIDVIGEVPFQATKRIVGSRVIAGKTYLFPETVAIDKTAPTLLKGLRVSQTANDVMIMNLQMDCSYEPISDLDKTVIQHVRFNGMAGYINYAGTYMDCVAGNRSFGYFGNASGVFIDCVAGDESLGYDWFGSTGNATGHFENCTGKNGCFGHMGDASGTFINCVGSSFCFGRWDANASGYFRNCVAAGWSFDTDISGGEFINCIAGRDSFGTRNKASISNARLVNCSADYNSFGIFNVAATNFSYNAEGYTFAGGPISGDGSGLTNLNLQAYAGANLVWDSASNKLNAEAGYSNAEAVAAVSNQWPSLDTNSSDDLGATEVNNIISGYGFASASNLNVHAVNTDNPHGVTATQLGACTMAEVDQAIEGATNTIHVSALDGIISTNNLPPEALQSGGGGAANVVGASGVDAELSNDTVTVSIDTNYLYSTLMANVPPMGDLAMGSFTNRPAAQ